MPRGISAINALWRERQEAALRAQQEADALSAQRAAAAAAQQPDQSTMPGETYAPLDWRHAFWNDPSGMLLGAGRGISAPPAMLPAAYPESARYWGAMTPASGNQPPLGFGAGLSLVPQAPDWNTVPIDPIPTPPFTLPRPELPVAIPQSAPGWLSDAQWKRSPGTLPPRSEPGSLSFPELPFEPVLHQESATHWGAKMPAPDEYKFKEIVPVAPQGVDIKANIELVKKHLDPRWFRDQVTDGGPWDYKRHFGRQYQDFGNFHYGVVASAFGFPESIIYNEAGRNQYYGKNREPNNRWGEPASRLSYLFPWLGGGTHWLGDDPWDRYWIERGIRYYNDNYRK